MKAVLFFGLALASVGVALYALVTYGTRPLGAGVHPEMRASFESHPWAIYVHAFAASLALLVGPWQFVDRWRARCPRLHRLLGQIYLGIGVGVGGLSGLFLAWHAFGGLVSTLGFAALASGWLYTGWRAFEAVRERDFVRHRAWMVRNYALTFSAVSLRLQLGIVFAAGWSFEALYPAIAWWCWVPNVFIGEFILRARATRPIAGAARAAAAGTSAF